MNIKEASNPINSMIFQKRCKVQGNINNGIIKKLILIIIFIFHYTN